ncbi:type III-B CRISPR module RAMP protein Cmr1 [Acanthopleuribacter pedis]|uniref:Type III-B CRISPR module RAMP protein Cmr1 n=1 Tax=Acanthopleuribacter pedis TaxID=442870 RepID=A0A8J7U1E3_9BACT|nr:type III-B CRISPR module RAMP protein Cmr1 [Acanthopleuribacter pedis]MBO1318078.1 type III-B CRISPR module RAMP protein Cmr1 [Acanthopleuribacter pedis]
MIVNFKATYRVVTPMFCGGADGAPELRLPSFKGVLRYWWRAWYWSRCGGDLNELKRLEDELFGSAAGGQGRVLLRWGEETEPLATVAPGTVLEDSQTREVVGDGARYLGYGVMEAFGSNNKGTKAGQLTRGCFAASAPQLPTMTVHLRCRDLETAEEDSVIAALKLVGLLGGMGAKSRKGYGSLAMSLLARETETIWTPPADLVSLKHCLRDVLQPMTGDAYPEITAFSNQARIVLITAGKQLSPLGLLNLVGREMVRYRSYGKNGLILNKIPSEKNFQQDHDIMRIGPRDTYPERIAFGLPHNYGAEKKDEVGPADPRLDRRASPLLIHVHPLAGRVVAILSFLPSVFLPKHARMISVGGRKHRLEQEDQIYKPVVRFLDRLVTGKARQEPFGEALEVLT